MQCQTCILHNYTSMCFRHSPSDTTRFVPFRSVDHSLQPDLQHSSIVSIQRRTFLRTSNKHAEWQFLCNSVFVLFERRGSHCCAQNGQCCAQNGRTAVHRTGSVVQRTDSVVHRTAALLCTERAVLCTERTVLCTERSHCCAQNGHSVVHRTDIVPSLQLICASFVHVCKKFQFGKSVGKYFNFATCSKDSLGKALRFTDCNVCFMCCCLDCTARR